MPNDIQRWSTSQAVSLSSPRGAAWLAENNTLNAHAAAQRRRPALGLLQRGQQESISYCARPACAGTVASVRLRFAALRSSVKKFPSAPAHLPALVPKEAALPPPGSHRARLPRGALAEAAVAASGNASEESEPEPEQLPPRRKVTRQQRAARELSLYLDYV